jgi:PTH1 family peptidyl-tRNA hydrolase
MENLYLIVGLGNPGSGYARTRHNVGFQVTEQLARGWRAKWTAEKKFRSRVARVERDGRQLLLCQPQTYMNESGEAVAAAIAFYRLPLERLMVVVDDADLPLGEIRLRARGSSGGHHGLESIERQLATREFARQRIGIGRTADGRREITGHVLGRFNATETALMEEVLTRARGQIECWLDAGIEKAMSLFNGSVEGSKQRKN